MLKAKTKIINLSLLEVFLREVDMWVGLTHSNRSEFIRNALRHYIKFLSKGG